MNKTFLKLVLFILSVGWLAPLWFSYVIFNDWLINDVFPVLYNEEKVLDSFPFYITADIFFKIGFAWLVLVVFSWAYYFIFYTHKTGRGKHVI